eukprot:311662-Amphidinium_carterae.1
MHEPACVPYLGVYVSGSFSPRWMELAAAIAMLKIMLLQLIATRCASYHSQTPEVPNLNGASNGKK